MAPVRRSRCCSGCSPARSTSSPNILSETLPFNILRMIHTNALIVWLLLGFFGATYYLLPGGGGARDLQRRCSPTSSSRSSSSARWRAVVGYLFGIHEGREFLEQPLWVKIGIVVAALIFLFNITHDRAARAARPRSPTCCCSACGAWRSSSCSPSTTRRTSRSTSMYWWFVVHLWVEGVWELIMASILAFLMHQADRRRPRGGREVALRHRRPGAVLRPARHRPPLLLDRHAGLLAVDRHDLLDASRSLPFFAMVVFAFTMVWKGRRDHPNKAALLWALGCP